MPSVELQSTHLMRTTFHIVPQSEQVQKRELCAFGQPTTELDIGGLPHAGQTLSATGRKSPASSFAASLAKEICKPARISTRPAISSMAASLSAPLMSWHRLSTEAAAKVPIAAVASSVMLY